jgi:hypothetical protein
MERDRFKDLDIDGMVISELILIKGGCGLDSSGAG